MSVIKTRSVNPGEFGFSCELGENQPIIGGRLYVHVLKFSYNHNIAQAWKTELYYVNLFYQVCDRLCINFVDFSGIPTLH